MGSPHSTYLVPKSLYPAVPMHHGFNSPPQLTGVMLVTRMLAQTNLESQIMASTEPSDFPCFSPEIQASAAKSILTHVIYL
jgi:hypothetical protein